MRSNDCPLRDSRTSRIARPPASLFGYVTTAGHIERGKRIQHGLHLVRRLIPLISDWMQSGEQKRLACLQVQLSRQRLDWHKIHRPEQIERWLADFDNATCQFTHAE